MNTQRAGLADLTFNKRFAKPLLRPSKEIAAGFIAIFPASADFNISISDADNRQNDVSQQDDQSHDASFELKEKTKQVTHVLTEAEIQEDEKRHKRSQSLSDRPLDWNDFETFPPSRPQFDIMRTGELRIEVHGWGQGLRRSWRDGKMQVLEILIDDIVSGLEAHIRNSLGFVDRTLVSASVPDKTSSD